MSLCYYPVIIAFFKTIILNHLFSRQAHINIIFKTIQLIVIIVKPILGRHNAYAAIRDAYEILGSETRKGVIINFNIRCIATAKVDA